MKLDRTESFHAHGFYGRVDQLYPLARVTPEARRRPLHWVKLRGSLAHRLDALAHGALTAPRSAGARGRGRCAGFVPCRSGMRALTNHPDLSIVRRRSERG